MFIVRYESIDYISVMEVVCIMESCFVSDYFVVWQSDVVIFNEYVVVIFGKFVEIIFDNYGMFFGQVQEFFMIQFVRVCQNIGFIYDCSLFFVFKQDFVIVKVIVGIFSLYFVNSVGIQI